MRIRQFCIETKPIGVIQIKARLRADEQHGLSLRRRDHPEKFRELPFFGTSVTSRRPRKLSPPISRRKR
jgi:hypothetical protein